MSGSRGFHIPDHVVSMSGSRGFHIPDHVVSMSGSRGFHIRVTLFPYPDHVVFHIRITWFPYPDHAISVSGSCEFRIRIPPFGLDQDSQFETKQKKFVPNQQTTGKQAILLKIG
jgi:hypothetical protein